MAAETERREGNTAPDWARKYPPLLSVALALLITLAVLPSALNLPQSNPQETLEYAPVPPDEENDSPPDGNLSALGLGSSSGIEGDGAAGGDGAGGGRPPPPPPEEVIGKPPPPNFRCSANNRQTFDPLAPPCVPFFEGDNFGETYQGVSGDEIRLVVYIDGGINYSSGSDSSNRTAPQRAMYDLFKTPAENQKANNKSETEPEHLTVKGLRVWQAYFNQRFQTYNRRVHFWVYFAGRGDANPTGRRANAAEVYDEVKPFAVLSFATEGSEDDFLVAMARKGVLNFGSFGVRPASFFNDFEKMIWGYLPSVEYQADSYASYICQKVANQPAVLAGPPYTNAPRKYGMIQTSDTDHKGLQLMASLVEQKVKPCGVDIAERAVFENCCLAQDNGESPDYAAEQMARFQAAGVTTILWPGGLNGNYGKMTAKNGYFPEWIVLGDTLLDANFPVVLSQNTIAFDDRAIVVTPQVVEPALRQQRCYQAYREIDRSTPDSDLGYTCEYYVNLFQFFVGIQVAGPRLGPTSIDQGFHAIPQHYDGSPTVPACFYLKDDYTCVKDAQAEIWDKDATPPGSNQPGCWKPIQGGIRYANGEWPPGNINAQIDGSEVCNGYSTSVRFNAA